MHSTPTEADKQQDLFDQIDRYEAERRANPEAVARIFCPWCFKINTFSEDVPLCCGLFEQGIEDRGKKQLESVIKQRHEMFLGIRSAIDCPYCKGRCKRPDGGPESWNRPYVNPACCDLMYNAGLAIAQKEELDRRIAQKKRIEDGFAQVTAKVGSN